MKNLIIGIVVGVLVVMGIQGVMAQANNQWSVGTNTRVIQLINGNTHCYIAESTWNTAGVSISCVRVT